MFGLFITTFNKNIKYASSKDLLRVQNCIVNEREKFIYCCIAMKSLLKVVETF